MTSDGISTSDWDRVHDLALAIVNANGPEESEYRLQLFAYLSELTAKYGELPSLLATRADYVHDDRESERLLLRAFELATSIGDVRNILEIALSLATLYVNELHNPEAAASWLTVARDHMSSPDEGPDWWEYRQVEKRLKSDT